jgi:uncharacterized protein YbbC (DUF1343 family)
VAQVVTGADRAVADPRLLGGGRLGLLTNYTGTTAGLGRTAEALLGAGAPITVLLGPEHGLNGSAQAGRAEAAGRDETTGLPVVDTYGRRGADLDQLIAASRVDTLVFDMQDVGVRTYTYVSTMLDALRSADRLGLRYVVLDRPNPLGGRLAAGPGVEPGYHSFVGDIDIPIRHGLTVGEIARLAVRLEQLSVSLEVIGLDGWDPGADWDRTGLAWVPPSPNLPTLESAYLFGGTVLFEGTNLSEGRGTTRPFEVVGAPWIDAAWVRRLRDLDLPGVVFREVWFRPTFSKYAGQVVRGVQVHITDRARFHPLRTALHLIDTLVELYPAEFEFTPAGDDPLLPGIPFIDLLWGSPALRQTAGQGQPVAPLAGDDTAVGDLYDDHVLLYPRV